MWIFTFIFFKILGWGVPRGEAAETRKQPWRACFCGNVIDGTVRSLLLRQYMQSRFIPGNFARPPHSGHSSAWFGSQGPHFPTRRCTSPSLRCRVKLPKTAVFFTDLFEHWFRMAPKISWLDPFGLLLVGLPKVHGIQESYQDYSRTQEKDSASSWGNYSGGRRIWYKR